MKPFAIVAAALVWVVAVARIRMLTKGSEQRFLWIALASVAIGLTLDIPRVAQALDELPGVGTNVSHLAKHAFAVVAAGAIWEVIRGLVLVPGMARQGRRRRSVLIGALVILLTVLFALAPVHDQPVIGLTSAAAGEPMLLAYWAVYMIAIGIALAGILRVTIEGIRTFPPGPVHTSMRWMGTGATIGLVYCAHKTFSLIASTGTSGRWPQAETTERVQAVLVAATLMTVAVGVLWPAAVRWPVVRHLIAYRDYRQLHPLWRTYCEAEPAIALSPYTDELDKRRLHDIELSLYRRIIEIRDGMLAVRHYADPRLREIALHEAKRAARKNPDLIGEAAWLELARRVKLHGDPPRQDSVPVTAGGADLASETHVLTRIAKAWPTVQAIADWVEDLTQARTKSR